MQDGARGWAPHRSEAWFPSPDTMWCSFLGNGLGDQAAILGVFKPVILEGQTLRCLVSDACLCCRVSSGSEIIQSAANVSSYLHCIRAGSDNIDTCRKYRLLMCGRVSATTSLVNRRCTLRHWNLTSRGWNVNTRKAIVLTVPCGRLSWLMSASERTLK